VKLTMKKLESWGYPSVEDMIVARVILTQCQRVSDGQSEHIWSDGQIYYTYVCSLFVTKTDNIKLRQGS